MNIDELDALHAAATAGKWQRAPSSGRILADGWPVPTSDSTNAAAIVALHNAWPEVSARLRAAEAEVERLRGALSMAVDDGEGSGDLDEEDARVVRDFIGRCRSATGEHS